MLYDVYCSFISTGAAEGEVVHPYLINENNIDRIIYNNIRFTARLLQEDGKSLSFKDCP